MCLRHLVWAVDVATLVWVSGFTQYLLLSSVYSLFPSQTSALWFLLFGFALFAFYVLLLSLPPSLTTSFLSFFVVSLLCSLLPSTCFLNHSLPFLSCSSLHFPVHSSHPTFALTFSIAFFFFLFLSSSCLVQMLNLHRSNPVNQARYWGKMAQNVRSRNNQGAIPSCGLGYFPEPRGN